MKTTLSRRQIETMAAALVATVTAILGIAGRDQERLGPKFLALEKVGAFREPVYLAQPPGGDLLFVLERAGRVRAVGREGIVRRPFLDIRSQVEDPGRNDEGGLLSIAFAPDYPDSGRFYVAYTSRRHDLRVVEYRRSASSELSADPASAREVLTIPQPTDKHHGGLVLFGPDGHLYVGSGDGGPSNDPADVAQDTDLLLGKLLRIDPVPSEGRPYRIPSDNPFVGGPGRDEIYAYGLRDPRRFSFDRATAALAIGDAGDGRFEEIDYVTAGKGKGANFGWPAYEGYVLFKGGAPRAGTVRPVLVYRDRPGCAVIGGYVVRDPSLTRIAGRELVGRYLFGDHCKGRVFAFRPRPDKAGKRRRLRFRIPDITSFGEDNAGRIYLVSERGGVWRLVARRKRQ